MLDNITHGGSLMLISEELARSAGRRHSLPCVMQGAVERKRLSESIHSVMSEKTQQPGPNVEASTRWHEAEKSHPNPKV
eukprot:7412242-Heterocapsa_arctica.AAC.1